MPIQDDDVRQKLSGEWTAVCNMAEHVRAHTAGAASHGEASTFNAVDMCHNLIMVCAYTVLKDVLKQLAHEECFTCTSRSLGPLIEASRSVLPWQQHALVVEGAQYKYRLLQYRLTIPAFQCRLHVDAISHEFDAWGVFSHGSDAT